ncbi:unnamed protein product [Effrenium voratum]|nr:unnamed protein product [Effrenium voratum]
MGIDAPNARVEALLRAFQEAQARRAARAAGAGEHGGWALWPSLPAARKRVLFVDNLDSFSLNVANAFAELGAEVVVVPGRGPTSPTAEVLREVSPSHIVLGPGPGRPEMSPLSMALARWALGAPAPPLLGICLGHQALGVAQGWQLLPSPLGPVHGVTEEIWHDQTGLFAQLRNPARMMRYNSLVLKPEPCPGLQVCAWDASRTLPMALGGSGGSNGSGKVFGVQFHPESAGSYQGHQLLKAFLEPLAARAQAKLAPLRLQHLTVQAVFSHWQGFSAQLRAGRLLAPLLMERLDLAVLRACFSGWRDVYGRNPAARSRAKAYDWTTRRSRCFTRVLCKAVEQTSQVTAESAARAALLSWCREVQRLRGQRLGTSQQLSDLHAITCMVWTQDQGRELMSHAITAWRAGVTQSRLETSRLRAGSRRAALLQSAQRLTDREPLLRLSFAFSIWRSLQVRRRWALVLSRGAGRGSLALLQTCLACWQREAASGASGRQMARRRRNHMKLSEAFAGQDRLVALLGGWETAFGA